MARRSQVQLVFKPVELVRVDIYVLKTHVSRVAWGLARTRLLHLVNVQPAVAGSGLLSETAQIAEMEQRFERTIERSKQLMELVGLQYDPLTVAVEGISEDELATLDQQLDSFDQTLRKLNDRVLELKKLAFSASMAAELLKWLAETGTDPASLTKSGRLAVRLGTLPLEQVELVEFKIAALPHLFRQFGEIDGGRGIVAVFLAADRDKIDQTLQEARFVDVASPVGPIAAEAISAAKNQGELSAELDSARDTLRRAATQSAIAIATIRRKAEIALGLAKARRSFRTVGETMIISGWVPRARLDDLRLAVETSAPGMAFIEVVDPSDLRFGGAGFGGVPVLFNNPLLLKPFEKMVHAYGTPQYGEVEPTAFLALSFLIMFGVMFGDLGQGLLLALAGYLIFRTSYRYTDLGVLLMECGAVASLFGVLYGSIFGADNVIPALWFNPMRNISTSMKVSLAFGATLISIGLLLNVVNSFRRRETSAAIFGEHGLVGAFMYWVCLAIGSKFLLTGHVGLEGWMLSLLLGLPALTILFRRPMEEIFRRARAKQAAWREVPIVLVESLADLGDAFLSYLANTVSFIRISAFSLAHVGLFTAVFALAENLSHLRGGGAWYWITLIVGNILIIALEGMMASIQAIRLEYYELFSKFFKGGGERFRPLEV